MDLMSGRAFAEAFRELREERKGEKPPPDQDQRIE
jgi:hypothetical protein